MMYPREDGTRIKNISLLLGDVRIEKVHPYVSRLSIITPIVLLRAVLATGRLVVNTNNKRKQTGRKVVRNDAWTESPLPPTNIRLLSYH